nr:MAG TPA: hypothetical protein [Caudoviricetes sp.]
MKKNNFVPRCGLLSRYRPTILIRCWDGKAALKSALGARCPSVPLFSLIYSYIFITEFKLNLSLIFEFFSTDYIGKMMGQKETLKKQTTFFRLLTLVPRFAILKGRKHRERPLYGILSGTAFFGDSGTAGTEIKKRAR